MSVGALSRSDRVELWRARLNRLANVFLLVVLIAGMLIWRVGVPLVERATEGVGQLLATIATAAAEYARVAVAAAHEEIQSDPQARAVLGEPIHFAPLEQVQWLESSSPDEAEFVTKAIGPRGEGDVRCRLKVTDAGPEVLGLYLTDPDGTTVHQLR